MLENIKGLNLIAIDPGGTTGIAVKMAAADHYATSTETSPEKVWQLLTACLWDHVIVEKFATGGRISKYGLDTVEIVGGIRALCHTLRFPISLRQPTQRYAWQETAKDYLKSQGTHHVIHEIEALAHLMAWQDKYDTTFALRGKAVIA